MVGSGWIHLRSPAVSYEHPLAHVIGVEGLALLRAFNGEFDRDFVDARLDEVRRLLDDPSLAEAGVEVQRPDTVAGYRSWAPTYDEPGNAALDIEEPIVRQILDELPVGTVLDAACGTGRHAAYLSQRGHQVIGVDSSPQMLAQAHVRAPQADLRSGELDVLPVDDSSVDAVVCALALTHLPRLGPAMAEFARVLRPGGHLVMSDLHHEMLLRGSIPPVMVDGKPSRLPAYRHYASDYLTPALAQGFRLQSCQEPRFTHRDEPVAAPATEPGPWHTWPWQLAALIPEAAQAANQDTPALIVWHFQLPQASH